jgi:hypothetical protein
MGYSRLNTKGTGFIYPPKTNKSGTFRLDQAKAIRG